MLSSPRRFFLPCCHVDRVTYVVSFEKKKYNALQREWEMEKGWMVDIRVLENILEGNLMALKEGRKVSAVRQHHGCWHASVHVMLKIDLLWTLGNIQVVIHARWGSAPTGSRMCWKEHVRKLYYRQACCTLECEMFSSICMLRNLYQCHRNWYTYQCQYNW